MQLQLKNWHHWFDAARLTLDTLLTALNLAQCAVSSIDWHSCEQFSPLAALQGIKVDL